MIAFSEENILKIDCESEQKNVKNPESLLNLQLILKIFDWLISWNFVLKRK